MKKISILYNEQAGNINRIKDIQTFCDSILKERFEIKILNFQSGININNYIENALEDKPDILAVAGGDGTLNSAGKMLIGTDVILGILPLGTYNHLAKDLKIPLDVIEALKLITGDNDVIKIDAGKCNEYVFFNNSGLGIYPRIVELRERMQKNGHIKWIAFIIASFKVLNNLPKFYIKIKIDEKNISKKTSFVFVGNNEYGLGGIKTGTRNTLTDGKLSLWLSHRTSALGLIELFIRSIFGKVKEHRDFDVFEAEEIIVETKRKKISVSFDGEVTKIESPLCYKIIPQCLNVIVPHNTNIT
jgi:YegS/Rv2252/BmrU family lipid kinase